MQHKLTYSSVCDKGLVRTINQDSVFSDADGYNGVFCVADGMGGHSNGEKASSAIISEIKRCWEKVTGSGYRYTFRNVFGFFENAIDAANKVIFDNYNAGAVCGSTVSLLVIYDSCYGIISVGDSRIYTCQKKKVVQATEDDVWENLPQQMGVSKDILMQSSQYGKLTNSVGTFQSVIKKYSINPLQGKTSFLLCSDGLYKLCSDALISKVISKNRGNPANVTEILANEVYRMGATDNFSIIYVNT